MLRTWAHPACRKPWGSSPGPHKPDRVAQACNPSILEVEAGGSEVQGQPQLHSKFKVSLGQPHKTLSYGRKGGREGGKEGGREGRRKASRRKGKFPSFQAISTDGAYCTSTDCQRIKTLMSKLPEGHKTRHRDQSCPNTQNSCHQSPQGSLRVPP